MKILNVIIVDDEENARLLLRSFLEKEPDVQLLGEAASVPEAVKLIHATQPDLVFLDIEMPGYSGLELLDFFPKDQPGFFIVFVTAYSDFALKAFELSAKDYLLKPVRRENLQRALQHVKAQIPTHLPNEAVRKLALQSAEGLVFLAPEEILYPKADGSYTHFYLTENRQIMVSRPLAE